MRGCRFRCCWRWAWFVALGVGLRVLAGASPRAAWRQFSARLWSWLALGAILSVLLVITFYVSVLVGTGFGRLGGPVAVLIGLICTYGLARLALALPAMLIDGHDLPGSLRRAASATRGRTLVTGTAVIVVGILPGLVLALVSETARLAQRMADSLGR